MKEDLHKYYIPKTFIKQEMRYNFLMGFIIGVGLTLIIGVLCWGAFFLMNWE